MSLKGTPYYDMARDAGASKGKEAEQMAQMIYEDQRRAEREAWIEKQLQQAQQAEAEHMTRLEQEAEAKDYEDWRQTQEDARNAGNP